MQEAVALGRRNRDGEHHRDVTQPRPGRREQAVLDVEHDFALNEEVVVERQRIQGQIDRALDRVLNGHEAEVDLTDFDGFEHLRDRTQGHELAAGQVRLRQQRLFGERAAWPQETDPTGPRQGGWRGGPGHDQAG